MLRLGFHVPKNLHGERRRQRAAEHPAPGQWTRLESGQATERVPLGVEGGGGGFFEHSTCFSFRCCDEKFKVIKTVGRHPRRFGQVFKRKITKKKQQKKKHELLDVLVSEMHFG